jgi:hypothetical protein
MKKPIQTPEQVVSMEKLDKAIQIANGVGPLADAIGVPSHNSISMWKKRRRVPTPWMRLIEIQVLKCHQDEPQLDA